VEWRKAIAAGHIEGVFMTDNINVGELCGEALKQAKNTLGHVNVLIIGRTGVGKSTLINGIFEGDFATTGQGRPVTKETREITKPGVPLSIFDTRGFELADFPATRAALKDLISARRGEPDANRHIHVAWLCISEDGRRVEQADTDFAEMLSSLGIPFVIVVTKALRDDGFKAEVQRLIPQAANVINVWAKKAVLDDGHVIEPINLKKLVNLTVNLLPKGQQSAFIAAQKADMTLKRNQAHYIVAGCAAAAAGAGFAPIPFADAVAIVPIQAGMVAKITTNYGLSMSDGFLPSLMSIIAGSTAATLSGRAIVGSLLKLIPGVGSVAGGAVSATVAASLTVAFGEAYIALLEGLFVKNDGKPPSSEEVMAELRKHFNK
jgi:uncharacterized protein (DUF697 family)/predicted GTPase